MNGTIHLDARDPRVNAIVAAAYPGKRAQRVQVTSAATVELSGTYWDGGTRSSYAAATLEDPPRAKSLPHYNPPQFGGPRVAPTVELAADFVIVEHIIFCGKDMGFRIYAHPDAYAPLLPPPAELDTTEALVLEYTARLKNSYGGDTDIRFKHAQRDTVKGDRWDGRHRDAGSVTREQWDAASVALKARGMLRKDGSVTPAGRTAADQNPNHDAAKAWRAEHHRN